MESTHAFEAFGFIIKEENFDFLSSKIIPETTVIEDLEPFPGYHGENLPQETPKPGHLFMITKTNHNWEDLMRITFRIKKYFAHEFEMSQATIYANNRIYPAIRIKNLESYEHLDELQKCYQSEGVIFEKKLSFHRNALTKVKKYFILKQLSEYVYHDEEDPNIHYLHIPRQINWQLFKRLTQLTRNNLGSDYDFDAAIGVIYRKVQLMDVIRIYGCSCTHEKLINIRKTYLQLLDKYDE